METTPNQRRELLLMQLNDVHGYVELHPEWFWEDGGMSYWMAGGYARLATLIHERRAQYPDATLLLDGGDTFHGTYPAVQTEGEVLLPILNKLGFDAMTAHWDFAYGPQRLIDLATRLTYPILAINVYYKYSDKPVFPPYRIVERAGVRIGIIGIASNIVDKMMPPHFSEGIRFTLGRDELPSVIETLRHDEAVDLIVLLSHLGVPQTYKLLSETPGIDVCLCAHTHNRLTQPLQPNGTLMIESGCHGTFLGELRLTLENGRIIDYAHQLIEVGESIKPDPVIKSLVDRQLAPYRNELAAVVGETQNPLDRSTCLESTMDNLLLSALLETTGAEVAFSNGWRYGIPIPAGPITLDQLYNIVPMNPVISTIVLTGKEILAMLETNLERTFSGDPYEQSGGYVKRAMGIRAFFKIENPEGARIMQLFVNQQPIEADQQYRVAFVTIQGVPAKMGTNRKDTTTHAIEAMVGYLARNSPLNSPLIGTFIAV